MAIKDLLVCLDATVAGMGRLAVAAHLAREHRARLAAGFVATGEAAEASAQWLGVEAVVGFPEGSLIAGVPMPERPEGEPEPSLAEIVERRFRDAVEPLGIEADWYLLDRGDTAELIELAKAADYTILGQVAPDDRGGTVFPPEEIGFGCGRPVLVVPYAGSFAAVGKRVLIGWDGSREAVRAVHDALPLMTGAEAVTVLAIGANEHDLERHHISGERICRHLAQHGLPARLGESVRDHLAISDVLLSRAADLAADLIVAGLYHHTRLREALLGGVSRELLQHMTVPVLMSH